MARATGSDALAEHLFSGIRDEPMAEEMAAWLAGASRFRSFAEANRDKIRKKLRGATDADARRDVRAELAVAHLLLADRRIDLAFEAYGSGKPGPDFSVAYRGQRRFNLEVTRLRRPPDAAGIGRVVLAKLRQMPPSAPNALLLSVEREGADVDAATRALRTRADAKDEGFFTARGFDGARGFYQRYLRLGAVVVWCEAADGDARAAHWTNRSARIAIPDPAVRACLVSLRAATA
ncbi:MAG: hypothetical protein ACRDFY_09060 [Candidatus Limnocylindria bacterium]